MSLEQEVIDCVKNAIGCVETTHELPEHTVREALAYASDPATSAQILAAFERLKTCDPPYGDYDAEYGGATGFLAYWMVEETRQSYHVGCPDWSDRQTLIFIVEAAKAVCGVDRDAAKALLRMALDDLESRQESKTAE